MESLITSLKRAQEPDALENLGRDELKAIHSQLETLGKRVKDRLLELSLPENDDPDYIHVIVDGKRDRIKKDIEVLNISCNSFSKLPDAIYQLKKLKKLYLYNNSFTAEEKKAIESLITALNQATDEEAYQSSVFEVAKEQGMRPGNLFQLLYGILLGKPRGPRFGPFTATMGKETVIAELKRAIES